MLTIKDWFDKLQTEGTPRSVPYGLNPLDSLVTGLPAGALGVVGAMTGQGKSAFCLGTALHAANRGQPVLMASLETTPAQLSVRAAAWATGFPCSAFHDPDSAEWQEARQMMESLPFYLDFAPGMSVARLSRDLDTLSEQGVAPELVVVDYLQLVRGDGESRERAVGETIRSLKELALERDVPFLVASQLNRNSSYRPDGEREPRLADLRDSGEIEQSARQVILIEWIKGDSSNQQVNLHVAKNTDGPVGVAHAEFIRECTRFEDTNGF